MTLRFQLDEHISNALAQQLERHGVDVVTAEKSGLLNTPDAVILEHAKQNDRVVVTFDADYVLLHRRGVHPAGIAYFPRAPLDVGVLVEALLLLDAVFESAEFVDWLEYM